MQRIIQFENDPKSIKASISENSTNLSSQMIHIQFQLEMENSMNAKWKCCVAFKQNDFGCFHQKWKQVPLPTKALPSTLSTAVHPNSATQTKRSLLCFLFQDLFSKIKVLFGPGGEHKQGVRGTSRSLQQLIHLAVRHCQYDLTLIRLLIFA